MKPDNLFTDNRLRAAIGARPFRFYPQIGSTNDAAREWVLSNVPAPSGALVISEEQIVGRGRFGRVWSAPPGTALLMSVIVRPRLSPERLPRLTMVGAVAVAETIAALAPGQVRIKWSNDVQLAGRKVAGILPEVIWNDNEVVAAVLGIGLNVHVDFQGSSLESRAVSVAEIVPTVNRLDLLAALLTRIDYWTVRADETELFQAWRAALVTLGQPVDVFAVESQPILHGEAIDVAENGALLVRTDDGTIHHVVAGEVTLSGSGR